MRKLLSLTLAATLGLSAAGFSVPAQAGVVVGVGVGLPAPVVAAPAPVVVVPAPVVYPWAWYPGVRFGWGYGWHGGYWHGGYGYGWHGGAYAHGGGPAFHGGYARGRR